MKAAFGNRWNLLLLAGAGVFAFLTGRPDVFLPLVAAGELAFLGMLGSHPRFQRYVDARDAGARRARGARSSERTLRRITLALPPPLLARYEQLRERCQELRQIALDLRQASSHEDRMPLDQLHLAGLDRLLWIHLRLLYTQQALDRFLERTHESDILADIARLEKRMAELGTDATSAWQEKARRTIEDNLETSRARLENLHKARENHELVRLEIDRLENKIRGLSELAVNRQEPQFISDQIDAVATSMLETERTMNQLQFATGLPRTDDQPPAILPTAVQQGEG